MELHCTLISLRPGHAAQGRRDVVVDAPEGTPGSRIAEVLARDLGVHTCTVDGVPLDGLKAGEAPLVNGCILIADGQVRGPRESFPLVLVVHTGPAAGTVVPLGRGVTRLGRSPGGPGRRCPLPDPALSREHAQIEVTDAAVVLHDLGSANGVWLQGRRVDRADISTGQEFRIGSSTCTLEFSADAPLLDPHAGSGPAHPLRVVRHSPPSRRAAMLTMAVLPLLIGVGMAVLTGMWMFLAFTVVSAISPLIPMVEGRSARRDFERRLRDAADDDAARRRSAAPDAGLLARAAGVGVAVPADAGDDAAPAAVTGAPGAPEVFLRLGTASAPANIIMEPAAPQTAAPPTLENMPFTAALRGRLAVAGGAADVDGLLRSLVLQLSLVPAAERLRVLVLGGDDATRLTARYLPRVTVLPRALPPESLEYAVPPGTAVAVVAFDGAEPAMVRAASELGWPAAGPASIVGQNPEAEALLDGARARFCTTDTASEFTPDLVPAQALDAAARRAASGTALEDEAGIPNRCGLDEMVPMDADGVSRAWAESDRSPGLRVPLGRTHGGTATLDLLAEGPHLLISGTTGSGKSELLRSLIAAIAALNSPARVTFLFVDFKGGSGLEPLAGLPHSVGLVTDLADGGMDRTLTSLRAELKRRERALAAARAADLGDYVRRGGNDLPRLVVVVDEFRILVEEAPGALTELLRIATVGRSLGMHLVMATQRPQGAISADIRANVTASISLRTQHRAESTDVIGSSVAADIPVRLPGRAYLSVGGGAPIEFQSASLGVAGTRERPGGVKVIDALAWLEDSGAGKVRAAQPAPSEAARPLVEATSRAWDRLGGGPVRTPLAEPLPDRLPWGAPASAAGPRGQDTALDAADVRLGAVDLPHEQRTAELGWSPLRDGHLALVGTSSSGASETLAAAAAQLAQGGPCRHLYVLDGDGSLSFLRGHPRVGASVGISEAKRAARVLARVGEECADRLSHGGCSGMTPLVLVVSAWGAWISTFRSGPLAWAEDTLGGLVRDGASAGLAVVAAGHRELVSSRAFSGMPAHLYFPLGTTEEARMSWPRLPAMPALAGRAAAIGTLVSGGPHTVQCYDYPDWQAGTPKGSESTTRRQRRTRAEPRPFRIDPLPDLIPADYVASLSASEASEAPPGGRDGMLVVGLAGDEVLPLPVPVTSGEALLVLGGPGSGKTTFLEALPLMNQHDEFIAPRPEDRTRVWPGLLDRLTGAASTRDDTRSPGRAPVVLVDDAHRLEPEQDCLLTQLLHAGARIVAAAQYGTSLAARCQIASGARYGGTGLVLQPRSPNDGDFFGVRVDVPTRVPPGRAVAFLSGRQIETQLGRRTQDLNLEKLPDPLPPDPHDRPGRSGTGGAKIPA